MPEVVYLVLPAPWTVAVRQTAAGQNALGRYPMLAGTDFRMAPTHGPCAPSYITDDYHRRLLRGDHLHHGLFSRVASVFAGTLTILISISSLRV